MSPEKKNRVQLNGMSEIRVLKTDLGRFRKLTVSKTVSGTKNITTIKIQ